MEIQEFRLVSIPLVSAIMILTEIIKNKIEKNGPISFRDFMDMCLYYPSLGYYTSKNEKIGSSGDFYTAPLLNAAFGHLIGKQLEEMWVLLGKIPMKIIEYGAGTGLLCQDILSYLKGNNDLYKNLDYCIIDKNGWSQKNIREDVSKKISWYSCIQDIGPFKGCVISNELIDNFAIHRVVMKRRLKEVFVNYKNGFKEILRPASAVLQTYLKELNVTLPVGFHTEINLQAKEWLKEVADHLQQGFVITFDYGLLSEELYNACRMEGTARCYYKHTMHNNFYINPGRQDITSHVNFSALSHYGYKYGLENCGYSSQNLFLRALGIIEYIRIAEKAKGCVTTINSQAGANIKQLLLGMGQCIKVLIQKKGLAAQYITGMTFSQKIPGSFA
ncbi:SAM-dependent methyltransferase [Danxiaibacter flavus]|uniref:SAM-dependent methyltransferase n=1 Tax=Danxiaibacter flavus TaxID=3049108 RepID=A0ABV3ZK09_9BACT|nr:SAM-dependent methyltransferase [Chitinophagaceae bacterium DXS]